jgi:hypothetical protein
MRAAWLTRTEDLLNNRTPAVAAVTPFVVSFERLHYSSIFYLNPDEGMHDTLAAADWHGVVGFYRHAIRTFHPPLFIPVSPGKFAVRPFGMDPSFRSRRFRSPVSLVHYAD